MFAIDDDACIIVRAIAAQTPGGREAGGLRISDGAGRGTDYAIEPVGGPEPGDVVVDQSGARVFLAPDVADALSDTVLEASVNREGVVDFQFGTTAGPQGMTEVRSTGHAH
ncbi:iron-sulfur cluster assembly accessory protein [Microbacterium sp.]|uniref:iron-sulfur cluster assembly accessory protein n=1 Tax=Microbacterium sp. TaxID=51671 RepID=UPI003A90974D